MGAVISLLLATGLSAACTTQTSSPAPAASAGSSPASSVPATRGPRRDPVPLTFGVFGNPEEIEAWETAVDSYNSVYGTDVRLRSWPSWRRADAAMRSGDALPDVFMVDRSGLAPYLDGDLTQPVDELLDGRGVNFGFAEAHGCVPQSSSGSGR